MADKKTPAKQQARTAAATAKEGAERAGLASPSVSAVESARNEGVTEAIKEDAKEAYRYATDGQLPGESSARQFTGSDEIMQYADLLSLSEDALKARIAPGAGVPVPEEKVAGLLALERAGQNRTGYVQLLCKRLGVKSPYEVTNAGPAYTNDTTSITAIER
jgi:hypothetical protein